MQCKSLNDITQDSVSPGFQVGKSPFLFLTISDSYMQCSASGCCIWLVSPYCFPAEQFLPKPFDELAYVLKKNLTCDT